MTPPAARIAAISKRLAAATPGPLQEREDHDYYQGGTYLGVGGRHYKGNEASGFDTFERDVCRIEHDGDKELLKHAHSDMTFLLGELDKAQAREQSLRERYESLSEWSLAARARVVQLERAMRAAMDNLGVPQPGYPAPVAYAHHALKDALDHSLKGALAGAEPAAPGATGEGEGQE